MTLAPWYAQALSNNLLEQASNSGLINRLNNADLQMESNYAFVKFILLVNQSIDNKSVIFIHSSLNLF